LTPARRDLARSADLGQDVPRLAKALPGAPLLAKTEFGRAAFFTAAEFEVVGYRIVI